MLRDSSLRTLSVHYNVGHAIVLLSILVVRETGIVIIAMGLILDLSLLDVAQYEEELIIHQFSILIWIYRSNKFLNYSRKLEKSLKLTLISFPPHGPTDGFKVPRVDEPLHVNVKHGKKLTVELVISE